MYENNTPVRIRYAETDQMGVVYHGNYAQFFEIGRTEWLRGLGTTYKEMEASGIMLPVVSLCCNFKKSAYYDDFIHIRTFLKGEPTAKIEFLHEIKNENGDVLCTGETILVFLNRETNRPMRCPDFLLEKMKY